MMKPRALFAACAVLRGAEVASERAPSAGASLGRLWSDGVGAQADDALRRLWDGEDLGEAEVRAALEAQRRGGARMPDVFRIVEDSILPQQPPSPRRAKVIGMFGSGTNLMNEELKNNFGEAVVESGGYCREDNPLGAESQIGCQGRPRGRTRRKFWKHTHPLRIEDFGGPSPLHLVAMVRNPLSQMVSWRRKPFNLWHCYDGDQEGLRPCLCASRCSGTGLEPFACSMDEHFPCDQVSQKGGEGNISSNFASDSLGGPRLAEADSQTYTSVMDVWNSYVRGYKRLAAALDGNVTLSIVRYEDLVERPSQVIRQVGRQLFRPAPHRIAILEDNQRSFDGAAEGRSRALQKIRSKSYLKELAGLDLGFVAGALDAALVEEFSYQDVLDSPLASL